MTSDLRVICDLCLSGLVWLGPHTCAKLIWHLSQTYTLQLVSIIPWPINELNSQPAWLNLDWNWSCDLWCWRFKHFLEIHCVTCVFVFSNGMVYCWFFNTDISENIRICVFAIVCTSETYLCHMRAGADYLWQEAAWQRPSSPYTFLVRLNIPQVNVNLTPSSPYTFLIDVCFTAKS